MQPYDNRLKICPECKSDNIRHFANYSECIDCMYKEIYGVNKKRKPSEFFIWR